MNPNNTSNALTFDKVNTQYTLTIKFKFPMVDYITGQPKMKTNKDGQNVPRYEQVYHLKKMDDPEYQAQVSELKRLFYLVNLHRKTETNSIESVAVFENKSKGGTIKGVDNKDYWLFSFFYTYQHKIYKRIFNQKMSEENKKYFNGVIDVIENPNSEYHKSLREELKMS